MWRAGYSNGARFFGAPLPVVLHITCAVLFIVLGALQFVASLRRRHPAWHRRAGRVVLVSGLVVASSALWMTQFYALPTQDGLLLYGFRLLFGSLMAVSLVLAFATSPLYSAYATLPHRPWGLSELADQQIAAGVMWVPGSLAYTVAIIVFVYRWLEPESSARRLGLAGGG